MKIGYTILNISMVIKGGEMKEETEIAKLNLENTNSVSDIYDNPVVKALLGVISGDINIIGTFVENGIEKLLQKRQKEKEKALLEAVFSDGSVTLDDIGEDFIFEFAMTYNAVMHLLQNEKVVYFANLLKNTVLNPDRDCNTFQESIERLCSLSYREIELLLLLNKCQEEYYKCNPEMLDDSNYIESTKSIWNKFMKSAAEKFGLPEEVVESMFSSIERTGFCNAVNILYPGATGKCYRTSLYFRDFCYDIMYMPDNC